MNRKPAALLGALALAFCLGAHAQAWPSKPIKIIVPFPAGGDLEPVARGLGEHFQETWKQPFVVDFKAGAQAMIGTEFVAKSPPDGYTLMICSVGAMTINPTLYGKVPYTVGQDIIPVSLVATTPMVLVAGPKMGVKTYADFLGYVKARPGKVSFASAGIGNVTHLTAELFQRQAGLQMVHVPYKGAQAVIADLMGGHIEMYFNPLPSARGYIRQNADKVTALAVTSAARSPILPDVPTLDELGMKGFEVNSWFGLCAPGGVPRDILQRLADETAKAVAGSVLPEKLKAYGMVPRANTPEQFLAEIRRETAQWGKIIRELNLKAE
jgi:tripartite-type tricarboxylate transporter receptor subunit TctC